jgi:hypothetical protein
MRDGGLGAPVLTAAHRLWPVGARGWLGPGQRLLQGEVAVPGIGAGVGDGV